MRGGTTELTLVGGHEGSNPAPSSGESIANLTFGRADGAVAKATALFAARPTGAGDPTLRGIAGIGNLIRGEAYVLGYIDGFWIIAWVLTAGIVLLLLLRSPLPTRCDD